MGALLSSPSHFTTTASLTVESSHTFLRCTVRCQSFVACVTTTTLQHHSPHLFDAFSYSRNAEQLQPSRLDFRSASKCLKQPPKPPPRLRVLEVTRRRRTTTLPSAASL